MDTASMPADGLTKDLPATRFKAFVQQIGLIDIKHLIKQYSLNYRLKAELKVLFLNSY